MVRRVTLEGNQPISRRAAYHREVPHDFLGRGKRIVHICAVFHEAHALAERHVAQKVPGKERYPIGNIARLPLILALHESLLKLVAERADGVVHERFKFIGALERVQFLDGPDLLGMELIAPGSEDVLDDVPILQCVVNGVELTLLTVSSRDYRNNWDNLP